MAGQYLKTQRQARIKEYIENGNHEKANELIENDFYSPLFLCKEYHPETEPDENEVNEDIKDILNDLLIVDWELILLAIQYENMLASSVEKLKITKNEILSAREKIMDMNMICSEDNEFYSVRSITNDLFTKPALNDKGVLTAKESGSSNVSFSIKNIMGNGIEGNDYIYKDGKFISEEHRTGISDYMMDGNPSTVYEYQKLNAKPNETDLFSDLSLDNTEAFFTITLESSELISAINIISPQSNIIIEEMEVSQNNKDYLQVNDKKLHINKRDESYKNPEYIYGTGIIAFPLSRFIKITFSSDGYTGEQIAYIHKYLE